MGVQVSAIGARTPRLKGEREPVLRGRFEELHVETIQHILVFILSIGHAESSFQEAAQVMVVPIVPEMVRDRIAAEEPDSGSHYMSSAGLSSSGLRVSIRQTTKSP